MKQILPYFNIGSSFGGNQDWFRDISMRGGGCAAVTAIEACIYLDLYKGTSLCPFDAKTVDKSDFIAFGKIIKPYLRPRLSGIDTLDIYIDGLGDYLKSKNAAVSLSGVEGDTPYFDAVAALKEQIDSGYPVPYLNLHHKDKRFKDYEWHWFMINGYEDSANGVFVRASNYSDYEWLDFSALYNTGCDKKGGLIIIKTE